MGVSNVVYGQWHTQEAMACTSAAGKQRDKPVNALLQDEHISHESTHTWFGWNVLPKAA